MKACIRVVAAEVVSQPRNVRIWRRWWKNVRQTLFTCSKRSVSGQGHIHITQISGESDSREAFIQADKVHLKELPTSTQPEKRFSQIQPKTVRRHPVSEFLGIRQKIVVKVVFDKKITILSIVDRKNIFSTASFCLILRVLKSDKKINYSEHMDFEMLSRRNYLQSKA